MDFAATLTLLFKDLALAYEEHEAFVAEVFGRPALLELASALQAVCDEAATRVLQRYLEARKV